MKEKQPTYSPNIIEIADYIYYNPEKKFGEILGTFGEKWGKPKKTLEKWYYKAKEYNQTRLAINEKIKTDIEAQTTKNNAENGLKTRNDIIKGLEFIFNDYLEFKTKKSYKLKSVLGIAVPPTASESIRAAALLAKMQGWEAPTKTDIKVEDITQPKPVAVINFDGKSIELL
jgi:hypothetical protein